MGEFDRGDPSAHEQLVGLLSLDFTRPEAKAAEEARAAREAAGSVGAFSLSEYVAVGRTWEDIDERLASEACNQFVLDTLYAVESAPVTESFKSVIAGYVGQAYAWESAVDENVSPERLGLLDGDGIFDPGQAKDIEGQALRRLLFDITQKYILIPEAEDDVEDREPVVLHAPLYVQAMEGFDAWALDYMATYGEDAFQGIDPSMHLEAARRARVMTDTEAEESGFAGLLERLRELRERNRPDAPE